MYYVHITEALLIKQKNEGKKNVKIMELLDQNRIFPFVFLLLAFVLHIFILFSVFVVWAIQRKIGISFSIWKYNHKLLKHLISARKVRFSFCSTTAKKSEGKVKLIHFNWWWTELKLFVIYENCARNKKRIPLTKLLKPSNKVE